MIKRTLYIALLLVVGFSCKKKDSYTPSVENDNVWIYNQMKHYYLWNDQLPDIKSTNTSLAAENYYKSILNSADRFSYIKKSDDATKSVATKGDSDTKLGFGFALRRVIISTTNKQYLQVISVYPGSAADKAGVKRGDLYSKVNNVTVDEKATTDGLSTVTLTKVNNSLTQIGTLNLNADYYTESPIVYSTVYTSNSSGIRVGYLVYNHFAAGTNNVFENQLKDIFADFKRKGVTELILDLRYNPGGELANAATLASMIVGRSSVDSKSIFAYLDYNPTYAKELATREKEYNITRFGLSAADAEKSNLDLTRLYVIATGNSASASEVTMHCLKQYINVVHIGGVTVGKDQGSFTVSDPTKKVKWELQPIVCKVFDKTHTGGYPKGLTPNIEFPENYLDLGDWGNIENEKMLQKALSQIPGAPQPTKALSKSSEPTITIINKTNIEDRGIIVR